VPRKIPSWAFFLFERAGPVMIKVNLLLRCRALKTLPITQYRMSSTSLRYPDHIFDNPPPPPPPWPESSSRPPNQIRTASPSLQWKQSKSDERTLVRVLHNLQSTLRSVHKHKVVWPEEDGISSKCVFPSEPFWFKLLNADHHLLLQLPLTQGILDDDIASAYSRPF